MGALEPQPDGINAFAASGGSCAARNGASQQLTADAAPFLCCVVVVSALVDGISCCLELISQAALPCC